MKAFEKGDRVVWIYKSGPDSAYSWKYKHGTFVRIIHPKMFIKGTVSPTEAMVRFDGNKNDSRVRISQLRYEQMTKKMTDFQHHFLLSDQDITTLWDLFMEYGMTRGEAPHRSKGNHYFLQAIGQYHSVEWGTWNKHLTKELRDIITKKFPQLMVENKQFEK